MLVRSVSVYGPIFSTLLHTFLPHLNAYDDFFQKCSTFLDGSYCIICKLRKTFAEEVVEFFLCLRAFENARFLSDLWASFVLYKLEREKEKKNRSPHSKVERYLEGENRTQVNKVLFMSCGLDMQFSDSCSSLLSRTELCSRCQAKAWWIEVNG